MKGTTEALKDRQKTASRADLPRSSCDDAAWDTVLAGQTLWCGGIQSAGHGYVVMMVIWPSNYQVGSCPTTDTKIRFALNDLSTHLLL